MKLKALTIKIQFNISKNNIKKLSPFQYKYFIQKKNSMNKHRIAFLKSIEKPGKKEFETKIFFHDNNIDIRKYEPLTEFYLLENEIRIGEGFVLNNNSIYLV